MPMPPRRDHRISLPDAAAMTKRFREQAGPKAEKAGMFPRECFEEILRQEGCAGIRIYYGREARGEKNLIMVGVDANGDDMTGGTLMELSFPCPPVCTSNGPLA